MRVILDTSFIMLMFELGRDLLSLISDRLGQPVEPVVTEATMSELRKLSLTPGKKGRLARMALEFAGKLPCIEVGGVYADESVLELARSVRSPVVTSDSGLLRTLREKGVDVIYVTRKLEVKVYSN